MQDMVKSNTIIHSDFPGDWDKYRFSHLVHQPAGIDPEQVYQGQNDIKRKLYGFPHYQIRMIKSFYSLKNLRNLVVALKFNQALKRGWQNAHYYRERGDYRNAI